VPPNNSLLPTALSRVSLEGKPFLRQVLSNTILSISRAAAELGADWRDASASKHIAAAAQERGRARALGATVEELLAELGGP
jgi:hypothetical protein